MTDSETITQLRVALTEAINGLAVIEARLQSAQDDSQRAAVAELRRLIAQGRAALRRS